MTVMTQNQTIGQRIRTALQSRQMSMRALSRELAVAQPTVFKWCHDQTEPPLSKVVMMSQLLNVPLIWLINGEAEEAHPAAAQTHGEMLFEGGIKCQNTDNVLYFHVESDDMEPTLTIGDIAVVDRTVTGIDKSGSYLIDVGGEGLMRRFTRALDGSLKVSCDNTARSLGVDTVASESRIKVIGRVASKVSVERIS